MVGAGPRLRKLRLRKRDLEARGVRVLPRRAPDPAFAGVYTP